MRAVKAQQNLLNITAGVKGAVLRDFCPGERCHLQRGIRLNGVNYSAESKQFS